MTDKFEQLEVWKLALDYIDLVYQGAEGLPRSEEPEISNDACSTQYQVKKTLPSTETTS